MARGFAKFHRTVILGEEWVKPKPKIDTSRFRIEVNDREDALCLMRCILDGDPGQVIDTEPCYIDAVVWDSTYPSELFWENCYDNESIPLDEQLIEFAQWAIDNWDYLVSRPEEDYGGDYEDSEDLW